MAEQVSVMIKVIQKYTGIPFSYGLDCCQFVGECVESITGKNPMDGFEYSNEAEAYEVIGKYGKLEDAMRATLGEPYDGYKDGDICLLEMKDGQQLAGVVFQGRVVVRAKRDLMDLPASAAKIVWCT